MNGSFCTWKVREQVSSQSAGQSVSRSASPLVSQSVGPSLATRARRPVSQSGQAVSKSDSRSVGLPVFKIYEEPASQTEGACLRYMVNRNRGVCKVCGGPFSPNAGACLGNMVIYDEPESPNEGACLTCMLNRYPHMRGRV